MWKNRIIIIILICLLLLPIDAFAITYAKVGADGNFNGDINIPTGFKYYINGTQISSDNLSDVASIAMLDENETVTGHWDFSDYLYITSIAEAVDPILRFRSRILGTDNVTEGDLLGAIGFWGYDSGEYVVGAEIVGRVDGTPGADDMPGMLEFSTTPDGSNTPLLRMVIDNAGNVKMGDGTWENGDPWTNYINVSNTGGLTCVGTATITGNTITANTGFVPDANDGAYLGTTALQFSDIFLAEGAVINFDSGDFTITQTGNNLNFDGGEIDFNANSVGFTIQTLIGDGADDINWKLGNYMSFTCPADAETFTFTAPSNPCGLTLQIKQDGVGGRDITFPVTVKWLGTEPTWSDGGASKTIIMSMRYDGTSYWSQGTSWEQ